MMGSMSYRVNPMRRILNALLRVGLLLPLMVSLLVVGGGPAWALTEEQQLVNEVWRIIDRAYVDPSFNHQNWWAQREKVLKKTDENRDHTYGQVQQMLAVLEDPFTRLLKPEQYRSLKSSTSGELTGVGLQIAQDNDSKRLQVIAPIAGSPAARAGIRAQDIILAIDGKPAEQLSLDEAAERMRGEAGSVVELSIERGGEASDYDLVRDRIALNPVTAELRPQSNGQKVGYIRLTQFNANASGEVKKAIEKLESQGAVAYVLDLRNNPGGLLQAGVDIARDWIDEGTIVYTVNRQGTLDSYEAAETALTDDPLAVLVNGGTASASEILAGALQDDGRGIIVGEKTFGKGLIQSLFDLSDGSGLAVTVAKYETPSHRDINKLGITPDRQVPFVPIPAEELGTDRDNQYKAALDSLQNPG
jgi:carboxyl-terminal processing protease